MRRNPTAPVMFATAFYVPHHHRLDHTRPTYWKLDAPGRAPLWIVCTFDELGPWITELYANVKRDVLATKMRTAVGTPLF